MGEGSAGEGVGSFHSSPPPGTCLPQTPEMGADGEKKGSRERERLGKGQGMGEEMEGEGEGGRERKKGMRESKYRETEIKTDGEGQKKDRDRETETKRGRVTCGDNEETKNRVSSLDICGCLPSMYLCICLSGVRHNNNNLLSVYLLSIFSLFSIYVCLLNYLPAYLSLIIYHLSYSDIER